MWDGKLKAITFSFDDGVIYDKKLIKLLDKYGCKATFNLNSELFGKSFELFFDETHKVDHRKVLREEVKEIYKNHEVASHTLTHPNLTTLSKEKVIKEVEEDRKALEKISGKKVIGFAYPCGGVNCNEEVAKILKENTGVKFARTICSSYNFDLQENLFLFNPTVCQCEVQKMFELGKKFVELKTDKPQLFYVWGHAYEYEGPIINYEIFEEFLKLISGKSDICYCTNSEAFNLN